MCRSMTFIWFRQQCCCICSNVAAYCQVSFGNNCTLSGASRLQVKAYLADPSAFASAAPEAAAGGDAPAEKKEEAKPAEEEEESDEDMGFSLFD